MKCWTERKMEIRETYWCSVGERRRRRDWNNRLSDIVWRQNRKTKAKRCLLRLQKQCGLIGDGGGVQCLLIDTHAQKYGSFEVKLAESLRLIANIPIWERETKKGESILYIRSILPTSSTQPAPNMLLRYFSKKYKRKTIRTCVGINVIKTISKNSTQNSLFAKTINDSFLCFKIFFSKIVNMRCTIAFWNSRPNINFEFWIWILNFLMTPNVILITLKNTILFLGFHVILYFS